MKWCEHIKWDRAWKDWIILATFVDIEIAGQLNFCPICGAKRPKKEKE